MYVRFTCLYNNDDDNNTNNANNTNNTNNADNNNNNTNNNNKILLTCSGMTVGQSLSCFAVPMLGQSSCRLLKPTTLTTGSLSIFVIFECSLPDLGPGRLRW